jgi:hypothetical protein
MTTYIIGDTHGQLDTLKRLLQAAGIVDERLAWTAGDAALWFMGDFFDRGPDGIGAVDLVMQLQAQAHAAGGRVQALLGNHDVLILAVARFGARKIGSPSGSFVADWRRNGGQATDLDRLTQRHIEWLTQMPALALHEERLLAHADATFYKNYGRTVAEVNSTLRELLHGYDAHAWDRLLEAFSERMTFTSGRQYGAMELAQTLGLFGGKQLIHGHTPISYMRGVQPESVTEPFVYQGGRCVNVDGGIYYGGPGFVYTLPPLDVKLTGWRAR